MDMKDLKSQFKPTPERFLYNIEQSIAEAESGVKAKRRRAPIKLIAVIAALIVAIPVGVFAAGRLSGMNVTEVGNYAVKFEIDPEAVKSSPKYVKFTVTAPNGYKSSGFGDGTVFTREDNDEAFVGFLLTRPEGGDTDDDLMMNITNKEEREINGRAVLFADDAGYAETKGESMLRYAVYFEPDVNILVTCIYSSSVDREDVAEFISESSVSEGTKGDHTEYQLPFKLDDEDKNSIKEMLENFSINYELINEGEYLSDQNNEKVKFAVGNFRYTDNVKDFKKADFTFEDSYSKHIAKDGSLIPQKRETWKHGDGINSIDELEKTEYINQKLLLIDVTYRNTGTAAADIFPDFNCGAVYLDKLGEKLVNNPDESRLGGINCYVQNSGKQEEFSLEAGDTRTVTIGFMIDEDLMDKTYIMFSSIFSSDDDFSNITFKAVKVDG